MSAEKVASDACFFMIFSCLWPATVPAESVMSKRKGSRMALLRSVGTDEQAHPRNSLPTTNLAWRGPLTWRNPELTSLEEQLKIPLLGDEPVVEMGMGGHEPVLLDRLQEMPAYQDAFDVVFPADAEAISVDNVARAIAAYERTIVSGNSPYDQWLLGQPDAMSESARRGQILFLVIDSTVGAVIQACFWINRFWTMVRWVMNLDISILAFTTLTGKELSAGRYGFACPNRRVHDMGRFRTPSLRNVTVTGPWGHDGSLASLDDVVTAYSRGGRKLESGQYAGDGAEGLWKDPWLTGFALSEAEREDLLSFLDALTDESVLTDERFSNPFCMDEPTDVWDCMDPVMGPGAMR